MSYYKKHDSYDKYRNIDNASGATTNRGKATYNTDGTLSRLDNISPVSGDNTKHHHEWLKQKSDGTYEYGHGLHNNH